MTDRAIFTATVARDKHPTVERMHAYLARARAAVQILLVAVVAPAARNRINAIETFPHLHIFVDLFE